MGKESRYADGRDANGGPGKKVPATIKWRKESNAEATVGHGIEQAVAGRDQKKIAPQREPADSRSAAAENPLNYGGRQKGGKEKRVRESTMPPKIAVANAKSKSDDVQVGKNGAGNADDPNTFWSLRTIEASCYAERYNSMRNSGSQNAIPFRSRSFSVS